MQHVASIEFLTDWHFRFHFELPKVDDENLPLYGGKIWFNGDNGEKLSVPYGGRAMWYS